MSELTAPPGPATGSGDDVGSAAGDTVKNLGELLGILKADGTVDTAWFSDPGPHLQALPKQLPQLLTLIDSALGPADDEAPDIPALTGNTSEWYSIPNPLDGTKTGFYLVAPKGSSSITKGTLGVGVYRPLGYSDLVFDVYAYAPLVELSTTVDPKFALTSEPIRIGLEVTDTKTTFSATGGVTFTGIDLQVDIFLDGTAPSASLTFTDLAVNGTPQPAKGVFTTLQSVVDNIAEVAEWISSVVLQGTYWLDGYVGSTEFTIGQVLQAACLLTDKNALNAPYITNNVAKPAVLVENFIFNLIKLLANSTDPIIPIPVGSAGSGIYVVREARQVGSNTTYDFGLRLMIEDIMIGGGTEAPAAGAPAGAAAAPANGTGTTTAPVEITVQLGKWIGQETDDDSWVNRSLDLTGDKVKLPGISVFLFSSPTSSSTCTGSGPDITFAPSVELVSLGIDVARSKNQPLIDVKGYIMESAELRLYVAEHSGTFQLGFGAAVLGLGVPLGPSFGSATSGASGNPVASSLLESGKSSTGATPAAGEPGTVNPAFGFSLADVFGGGAFVAQLYDAKNNPAAKVVIPIQKALGPLQCEKLGLGWIQDVAKPAEDRFSLLFDGGVELGTLSIDLVGLSIGVPVATPGDFSKYEIDLDGMGISFSAGPVKLSGSFVKLPADPTSTPPRNYTEYDGEALLEAGTFAISALGSYAYVPGAQPHTGYASMFIFAMVDATLGGPAFFFVTGLAAGFGYNRTLELPGMDDVTTFPLVEGASDPAKLGATKLPDGSYSKPDPAKALSYLDKVAHPERGQYWLAAGIRFTSFDLINSTVLLIVEFGHELEIAVLGVSWASFPPAAGPGAAAPSVKFAYIELGIEIKILPDEGEIIASAILTPASFVLDAACKLTGGFAFAVWFGPSPHAGDFVLTVGGYHPDFKPPGYYPQVPRLGFNWPMPGGLSIGGQAYFALTSSAIMVGGRLDITFDGGIVKAWFKAWMDALIEWAPFHFELDIGISIGVSLNIKIWFIRIKITLELGADLTLWGPEFGGVAHIHLWIISFTIGFGASQNDGPPPLSWSNDDGTGFGQTMLPHKADDQAGANSAPNIPAAPMAVPGASAVAATPPADGGVTSNGVFTINVSKGLLSTITDSKGKSVWIVRPNHFTWSATTTIPTTAVHITPVAGETAPTSFTPASCGGVDGPVYFRPMKTTLSSSVLQVGVVNDDAGNQQLDLAADFTHELACGPVPAAKFGKPLAPTAKPEFRKLILNQLLGLTDIVAKAPTLTPSGSDLLMVDIRTALVDDAVDDDGNYTPDHLPLVPSPPLSGSAPKTDATATATIHTTLDSPTVQATRTAVFDALGRAGVNVSTNGSLTSYAANPEQYLAGQPLIATQS